MISLRILIADDQPLVRVGLRMLLGQHGDWMVCGEAEDGIEAIKQAVVLQPDIILLDISMPKLDGLGAVPLILGKVPNAAIIVLTLHDSLDMARIASRVGAAAYITKSLLTKDLVPAIEKLQAEKSLSCAN
jgi:DNA-binding NarL/FixJ family response regulator